jgi:hypothetical protein
MLLVGTHELGFMALPGVIPEPRPGIRRFAFTPFRPDRRCALLAAARPASIAGRLTVADTLCPFQRQPPSMRTAMTLRSMHSWSHAPGPVEQECEAPAATRSPCIRVAALLSCPGRSRIDRIFSSTHRRRIRVIGQVGKTADRAPRKWYASAALLSAFKCAGISNWKDRRDTATLFERQKNNSAGIVSTRCRWTSFVPVIETIESRAQLISESFSSIHNWRQVRKRDARPQSRVDTDTDRIRTAAQLTEAIQHRFFLRLPLQHADGEGLAIEARESGLHRQSRSLRRHSRLSPRAG